MYDKASIGRRLKSGLTDRGQTNEEFANEIGVSRHTVDAWVCGKTGMSLESAILACDYLNWPLDRLAVRGTEKKR